MYYALKSLFLSQMTITPNEYYLACKILKIKKQIYNASKINYLP